MNEKGHGLKICCDRIIPEHMENPAFAEAHKMNVARTLKGTNFKTPREAFVDLDHRQVVLGDRMCLLTPKMWQRGSELKCRFIGGSSAQQQKAIDMASEWMQYANIKIILVNTQDEQVRIAFNAGQGSWSAIGQDCLVTSYFPREQPTMNFGWLDENTPDEEWRRVVVHEFGHALGCAHEHQSPNEKLEWNKEAVYAYFSGPPNNWNKQTIDKNILKKYSPDGVSASLFDPDSIMLYMFPPELFTDCKGTNNNTDLSDKDKAYIAQMYPK